MEAVFDAWARGITLAEIQKIRSGVKRKTLVDYIGRGIRGQPDRFAKACMERYSLTLPKLRRLRRTIEAAFSDGGDGEEQVGEWCQDHLPKHARDEWEIVAFHLSKRLVEMNH